MLVLRPKLLPLVAAPLATFVASPAYAAPPGSDAPRDEINQRLERGVDAADAGLGPVEALRGGRSSLYVSLQGFVGNRDDGRREVAGMLAIGVPLGRFAAPRRGVAAEVGIAQDEAPKRAADEPASGALDGLALHAPFEVVVSAAVARACVRAAYRAHGLADDSRTDSLAARSRASAALPELRLRAARTTNASATLSPTQYDPYRYTEGGTTAHGYEARMTWRLDRLIFAADEISIERIRMERAAARSKLAAKVLRALFEWQRAHALELDAALPTEEHLAAVLRALEAEATLDVLTDGWFGRFRAETLG